MAKKEMEYIPAVVTGCAIGDALGMPFEMRGRAIHPKLKDWDGKFAPGNHHKLDAGTWTDDTEMTVALSKALIDVGAFDGKVVADNYLAWFQGNPTGMGGTTREALTVYNAKGDWQRCGVSQFPIEDAVGAGTVMRAAPLGVFYHEQPDMLRVVAKQDAYITHRHLEAFAGSLAVVSFVAGIINFRTKNDPMSHRRNAIEFMMDQLEIVAHDSKVRRALAKALADGSGFSNYPVEVADRYAGRFGNAWQIATTAIHCAAFAWSNFPRGVKEAVSLGGDTDTRGAVTGAILGAVIGLNELMVQAPDLYNEVKHKDVLATLDRVLWERKAHD